MKKIICIFFIVICLSVLFSACSTQTHSDPLKTPTEYVHLCNYTNFEFDKDDITCSDDETWVSIKMKLQSEGVDIEDRKDFTDELAVRYFSAPSSSIAFLNIKQEIISHRICETAYEQLISGSMVKVPEEANEYAERIIEKEKTEASKNGISKNDFFTKYLECTEKEIREDLINNYMEMIIVRAWAEKENIVISNDNINEKIKEIAEDEEISRDEVLAEYESFVIEHYILCDKLTDYYMEHYMKNI